MIVNPINMSLHLRDSPVNPSTPHCSGHSRKTSAVYKRPVWHCLNSCAKTQECCWLRSQDGRNGRKHRGMKSSLRHEVIAPTSRDRSTVPAHRHDSTVGTRIHAWHSRRWMPSLSDVCWSMYLKWQSWALKKMNGCMTRDSHNQTRNIATAI